MSNPYEGLQSFVDQLPELVQPLIIAGLGAVPYIEGEGSAAIGIIAGINPIVAGVAGAIGNILAVLGVVLLSSRVRESVVARRSRAAGVTTQVLDREESTGSTASGEAPEAKPGRRAKGQQRLRRWLVKFGVPGASLLAPLALPTTLTAAFFVGSGVSKGWVLVWQVVAILLWTGLVTAAATGVVSVLGW